MMLIICLLFLCQATADIVTTVCDTFQDGSRRAFAVDYNKTVSNARGAIYNMVYNTSGAYYRMELDVDGSMLPYFGYLATITTEEEQVCASTLWQGNMSNSFFVAGIALIDGPSSINDWGLYCDPCPEHLETIPEIDNVVGFSGPDQLYLSSASSPDLGTAGSLAFSAPSAASGQDVNRLYLEIREFGSGIAPYIIELQQACYEFPDWVSENVENAEVVGCVDSDGVADEELYRPGTTCTIQCASGYDLSSPENSVNYTCGGDEPNWTANAGAGNAICSERCLNIDGYFDMTSLLLLGIGNLPLIDPIMSDDPSWELCQAECEAREECTAWRHWKSREEPPEFACDLGFDATSSFTHHLGATGCSSSPCSHTRFYCDFPQGCDSSPSPCQNGGECIAESSRAFICNCASGWEGDLCELAGCTDFDTWVAQHVEDGGSSGCTIMGFEDACELQCSTGFTSGGTRYVCEPELAPEWTLVDGPGGCALEACESLAPTPGTHFALSGANDNILTLSTSFVPDPENVLGKNVYSSGMILWRVTIVDYEEPYGPGEDVLLQERTTLSYGGFVIGVSRKIVQYGITGWVSDYGLDLASGRLVHSPPEDPPYAPDIYVGDTIHVWLDLNSNRLSYFQSSNQSADSERFLGFAARVEPGEYRLFIQVNFAQNITFEVDTSNCPDPSTTTQPTAMPSSPPSTHSTNVLVARQTAVPTDAQATHMPSDSSLFGSLSPGESMAVYFCIAGGCVLCVYLSIMAYKAYLHRRKSTTARSSSVTTATYPGEPIFETNKTKNQAITEGFYGEDENCGGSRYEGIPESSAYGVGEIEMNTWSVTTGGDTDDSEVIDGLQREVHTLSEQSDGSFGDPKRELEIQVSGTPRDDDNESAEHQKCDHNDLFKNDELNNRGAADKLQIKVSDAQLPASSNGSGIDRSNSDEKRDEGISPGETVEVDPLLEQKLETNYKSKSALSPSPASPVLAQPPGDKVDLQALRCPITLELMSEPVILFADGHTYEKQALDQWFSTGRRLSPITGEQIASTNYTTNWTVKSLVEEYLTKYPEFQKQAKPADAEQRSLEAAVALRERDMEAAARKISVLKRDNDDLKINSNKHDEILAAISRVSTQVDAGFSKLSTHLAELGLEVFSRLPGGDVPRLFVVLPDEWFSGTPRLFGKVKSVFNSKWRVLPLCEGNDCFSECHINTYHEGYTISITRQWLQKSMPVIKVALKVVCVATQVASSGAVNLGPLARLLPSDTENIIELWDTLAGSVGMAQDRLDPKSISSLLEDERLMREGSAELATILAKEKDKTGGLQQMYNASNQVVWVCPDHTHGLVGPNRK